MCGLGIRGDVCCWVAVHLRLIDDASWLAIVAWVLRLLLWLERLLVDSGKAFWVEVRLGVAWLSVGWGQTVVVVRELINLLIEWLLRKSRWDLDTHIVILIATHGDLNTHIVILMAIHGDLNTNMVVLVAIHRDLNTHIVVLMAIHGEFERQVVVLSPVR